MTFVVLSECDNCKYTDCVESCPVDCFHEGETMLYINPDGCIDCGVCVDDCPISAIASEADLTEEQLPMVEINRAGSQAYPVITEKDPARCMN